MPPVAEVKDDTRTRVLQTALALIAEKGFAATSTREVCERMGFTKAALYYHFKAKGELLSALLHPVVLELADLVSAQVPTQATAARRQAAVAYVDLVSRHADVMRVLYDDPSVRTHPELAPVKDLYRRLQHLLTGTTRPDAAGRARARAATGAVHAAILRGEPSDDPAVLRAAAAGAACAVLGVPPPRP